VTPPGPREEIDALAAEGAKTSAFLRGLDAPEWKAPTRCPPWNVRELVVHMTMMMEGVSETAKAAPLAVEPVKNRVTWWDYDIEEDQAETLRWVEEAGARLPEGSLYDRWHSSINRAVPAVIGSLEDGDPVVQPGDNPILISEYIATRVLEITIHSMDVRDAFGLGPDPSPEGLTLTVDILERRLGSDPRAMGFEDVDFTLLATGRRTPTAEDRKRLGSHAGMLPLLA
jgi:uncharacterized protein (TIGR03083 family)